MKRLQRLAHVLDVVRRNHHASAHIDLIEKGRVSGRRRLAPAYHINGEELPGLQLPQNFRTSPEDVPKIDPRRPGYPPIALEITQDLGLDVDLRSVVLRVLKAHRRLPRNNL